MVHPVIEHLGRLVASSPDSLRVLEKRCGVSRTTLGRMAKADESTDYTLDSVARIADALGFQIQLKRK